MPLLYSLKLTIVKEVEESLEGRVRLGLLQNVLNSIISHVDLPLHQGSNDLVTTSGHSKDSDTLGQMKA